MTTMLNKVTFIFGDSCTGKTSLLKHLIKGKKALGLSAYRDSRFLFKDLAPDTEVVWLDGIITDREKLMALVTCDALICERQSQAPLEIKRPPIIVTSNVFTQADFRPRPHFEFFTCLGYDETSSSITVVDGNNRESKIFVDPII